MDIYWEYVILLADPATKDETKLKAAREMSENFEVIISSPRYATFLGHMMKNFLKILEEGEPLFISENDIQMVRKLILQMILQLPINDQLRPYVTLILSLMLKLLESDNEENVLVCLRIILKLHKQYRPAFNPEIPMFMELVKSIYRELPTMQPKIFEPRPIIHVDDLSDIDFETLLKDIVTITPIKIRKKGADGSELAYNLIPKAAQSLKVLQELPAIVTLMYQIHTRNVHQDVTDFVPLIMTTITLQPSPQQRASAGFNNEVFVHFVGAQIRTLSFLAYIVRIEHEIVAQHSDMLVKGVLGLMTLCPMEAAHLRKELLTDARHILATELRDKFAPHMESLLDEDVLLGRGWATRESLRPFAYCTLADLVYQVRKLLPLSVLARAVHSFSKHVHDRSLHISIQMVSCNLLLNLVEEICRRSEVEDNSLSRELLVRMLEVFVLKFKTVTKLQMPVLLGKAKRTPVTPDTADLQYDDVASELECPQNSQNYNVDECRGLVKVLVTGVKTITSGCVECRIDGRASNKFHPKETLVFIRLVKWAFRALDIYTMDSPMPSAQLQEASRKKVKETLKHFGGTFARMDPRASREIFSTTMKHMVERHFENAALQTVFTEIIAHPTTSPIFTTYLLEHLLETMDDMGSDVDRSDLNLKLFKFAFTSVTLFPAKNEVVLRPHVRQIANRSMELGMSAKEPYNYFLLLSALFKVICGGPRELLYQELLPILPNLLEGLARLQSGPHKQHMKDLFVELCLIVPISFFSITPHLPVLMEPLVSALNGNDSLVSVGFRLLELLTDNLQPDALNEYVQPLKTELVQALRKLQRHPKSQIADKANRALRKLGDDNDTAKVEPRKSEYLNPETNPPAIVVNFDEPAKSIDYPMEKVIDTAVSALISNATEPFYREQCWQVIHCYLAASLRLDDDRASLHQFFAHPSFMRAEIPRQHGPYHKCPDAVARNVQQTALTGLFAAAAIEDLRPSSLDTMLGIVRHYTMLALAQQAGPLRRLGNEASSRAQGQDPLVLVNALAAVVGHENEELCEPGKLALALVLDTASSVLGSRERACQLPLVDYLAERVCSLCYERAWHAKRGGCAAIGLLLERVAAEWLLDHLLVLVRALVFAMTELTGEVSYGVVDVAKANLEKTLRSCASTGTRELVEARDKALRDVSRELMKHVTSPHAIAREQAVASLRLLAEIRSELVSEVTLVDVIPPKGQLLMRHRSDDARIGLMDGCAFGATLNPRLFGVDLESVEREFFFDDLLLLTEDVNSIPLRKSALRALVACRRVAEKRECTIFEKLCAALENAELRETAFECMRKFIAVVPIDVEAVNVIVDSLLMNFDDDEGLSLDQLKQLFYLSKLFPGIRSVNMCEQLLAFMKKLGVSSTGESERMIATIIEIFHEIPSATPKFIHVLCRQIFEIEETLLVEHSSLFRKSLMKILSRCPEDTMELFMNDVYIKNQQWNRYLIFLIKHKEGKPFRHVLQKSTARLIMMLLAHSQIDSTLSHNEKSEMQHQAIRIVSVLIRFDEQWLSSQTQLVAALRQIWCDDDYHALHKKIDSVDFCHWKEPKLIVKILLHYFCHHTNDIDLLFQLLRATTGGYVPDFQFLRDFLENAVAQGYTVEWKTKAFFAFVEHFSTNTSPELKAKIVQLILIPCFAVSFKKGEATALIGSAPMPYRDSPDDIVSVFVTKIIDPANSLTSIDCLRIALLQLSCLFVELAPRHIHDDSNEQQSNRLTKIISFAWPCLHDNNCMDPLTRYHGHLLLSHAIAKFTLDEEIVLQVFRSLLKANEDEARYVVRKCLDVIIPVMPARVKDGLEVLTQSTITIILEDSYDMQPLLQVLQQMIRQQQLYYPMRHRLVRAMISCIRRLGFSRSIDHRRLAVGLAGVIVEWEQQRSEAVTRNANAQTGDELEANIVTIQAGIAALSIATAADSPGKVPKLQADASKPIEAAHANAIISFLLKFACQACNDPVDAQGEQLSRRCVALLKVALKLDCWPKSCDLELGCMAEAFLGLGTKRPNYEKTCTALEMLTFLLSVMRKKQMLAILKPLHRGLEYCILCENVKVTRALHALLIQIMSVFPTDQKYRSVLSEELKMLYDKIGRFVITSLTDYDIRTSAQAPTPIFGPIMILDAVCTNDESCMSCLIPMLAPVLRRMVEDHVRSRKRQNNQVHTELMILAMSLLKDRMAAMDANVRKSFIGAILVGLIEGTRDVKLMKEIMKMLEEWLKNKDPTMANRVPRLKETTILMVKMMQNVEKRFPDDLELNARFLELVNRVYRDETLKASELTSNLEPAFLSGLRCVQPHIRAKFVELFNGSTPRRGLHERLLYIIRRQSCDAIGSHYWIKQCIELLIAASSATTRLRMSNQDALLPSVNSLINRLDSEEQDEQHSMAEEEMMTNVHEVKDVIMDVDFSHVDCNMRPEGSKRTNFARMMASQAEFLDNCKSMKTVQLLNAVAQLCHMDTSLAERVWLDTFPRLWGILDEHQRTSLIAEIVPLVSSDTRHVVVREDCHPSATATFAEALSRCNPPVPVGPASNALLHFQYPK